MVVPLSRRAVLALLLTPALAAGCGGLLAEPPSASPTSPAPTSAPTVGGTPPPATSPIAGSPAPAGASPAGASPIPGSATVVTGTPPTGFAARLDLTNPRRGGRLVQGWINDVRTLNPLFVADVVTAQATALLFSGLVKINPTTLAPEGDLAVDWQAAGDGLSYRFRLRPNATFHDGKPCTAEDVEFTYDLLLKEAVGAPAQADLAVVVESVKATSPTEVEVRLKAVSAPFLVTHASYGIVPKHLLTGIEPAKIEQSEFSLLRPVGSGPFRFKEWRRGSSLALTRHDGAHVGPPFLDEVVLKVVPSQEILQTQLKLGEVDVGPVREADAEEIGRQQNLILSRVDSLSITYLGFQLDPARTTLFQDRQVRQALAFGLDREAMIRLGRYGLGRVAGGPVPPPSWAAGDRLASRLAYDPARAEALLDGLGWRRGTDGVRERDGKRLAFELLTNRGSAGNRVREQYGLLVQEAWKRLGADVRLTLVDFQEVVGRLRRTHEFDVYLAAFAFDFDPDQRLLWSTDAYRSGFNASRYSNAAVDKLLTDAVQTTDQSRRRDLYARVQELLVEEVPAIVIDYPQAAWAVNKRARNVIPNPSGLAYNAHQWWVVDGK